MNDFFKDFAFKRLDYLKDVYAKTRNPVTLKQINEIKEFLYKYWFIEVDEVKRDINGQGLLF